MERYIILDYFGSRKATIKANTRKAAHIIYSENIDWFLNNTICVSEGEYNEMIKTFKKI